MNSQKHLFTLPGDVHYLNGAYMSPLMKSVQDAGIVGISKKADPSTYLSEDFFEPVEELKRKFGKLIHAAAAQIAVIPSASYGLKNAVSNLPLNNGDHAIVITQEFPSDYYTISNWCKKNNKSLKVIEAPIQRDGRAAAWNERIIDSITNDTAVIVISSIHWADGTIFDLRQIGEKCKATNTKFIVDGTQSVGAIPMNVIDCGIDALIVAGYKWLLGPYSIGLAYYSEFYNEGEPIEDTWMNKTNAYDFSKIVTYTDAFRPGAARYNVGEFGNPISIPMLDTALSQLLEWGPNAIQDYCGELIKPLLDYLEQNGFWFEEKTYRPNHLFGFLLPHYIRKEKLLQDFKQRKVFVSVRGEAIRISPNVYNLPEDINTVIEILEQQKNEVHRNIQGQVLHIN